MTTPTRSRDDSNAIISDSASPVRARVATLGLRWMVGTINTRTVSVMASVGERGNSRDNLRLARAGTSLT